MSLKRALYSLILYLISPLVVGRLLWRSRKNPAYRQRIFERFGLVNIAQNKPVIWLHAVSVGETNAATPLVEALLKKYPEHHLLLTTTTPTGSDRVRALFSDRVEHCYFPYDLPDVVARFIQQVNPTMLIVVETEIWPNLFASCHQKDISIVLVNARLSIRSTQAYLKIKGLIKETLEKINKIAVRSQADADSFKKLGAIDKQIIITGNIKFDFEIDQLQVNKGLKWREQWGTERLVFVAASTHKGEEEILVEVFSKLRKDIENLLLVLVPRHPERFDSVYQLCTKQAKRGEVYLSDPLSTSLSSLRHSQVDNYHTIEEGLDIIVGDSMGEMQSWYAVADVVFIGGSLVDVGGHNPLEAVAQKKPVVSGQYMFNFRDIVPDLIESRSLTVCEDIDQLQGELAKLFSVSSLSQKLSKTDIENEVESENIMQTHRGATTQLLEIIDDYSR